MMHGLCTRLCSLRCESCLHLERLVDRTHCNHDRANSWQRGTRIRDRDPPRSPLQTKRKIRKQAPASERHSEKLKKQRTELGVVKRKLVDKERQDKNFDRAYQENWDAVQMEFTQIQKHNKELEEPAC